MPKSKPTESTNGILPEIVILAGGLGTRMREETEYRPKPMAQIGRWPVLWHIMKTFSQYDLNRFVICLGYKGEMIKDYFLNYRLMANDFTIELNGRQISVQDSDDVNWRVTLADTGLKAMTGARVKRIQRYIQGDYFLLTYGDGVANINIKELIAYHKSHGKIATVTGVAPPSRFGELLVRNSQVIEFSEKPQTHSGLINGGFFVLNRKIFDYLSEDDDCTFEKEPLEHLAKEGQLMTYTHKGFWHCMDTLRDMQYLNELWNKEEAPWKTW